MNWDAISAISEIIGAVAVVVSLIYVAVQIRQNTKAIRGSTLDAITAHQQAELRWSGELATEFRKAIEAPETLSFEERWQLSEWMTAAMTARQNEFHQYQQGLLDDEVWSSIESIIKLVLGNAFARTWWHEAGRPNLSRSFVVTVERIVDMSPDNSELNLWAQSAGRDKESAE